MKVYLLELEKDTQICSSIENAINVAKKAISLWPSDTKVNDIDYIDEDVVAIRYSYSSISKDKMYRDSDTAWIYPYEIDGGPFK